MKSRWYTPSEQSAYPWIIKGVNKFDVYVPAVGFSEKTQFQNRTYEYGIEKLWAFRVLKLHNIRSFK